MIIFLLKYAGCKINDLKINGSAAGFEGNYYREPFLNPLYICL